MFLRARVGEIEMEIETKMFCSQKSPKTFPFYVGVPLQSGVMGFLNVGEPICTLRAHGWQKEDCGLS